MGQQQLLLLVLGIVVVGLAVVVGIRVFSVNATKANADAMTNDVLRIANDVQAWSLKPALTGGGGGSLTPLTDGSADLASVGYKLGTNNCGAAEYGNNNACYALSTSKATGCATDPTPEVDGGGGVYINGHSLETDNWVCVLISGTRPEHIGTAVTYGT